MTPERAIVEGAHRLACDLPTSVVESIAAAIMNCSPASLRAEIARRVAHHQHRDRAYNFLDHWQVNCSHVTAQTVAVALQTAALSEQVHHDSQSAELVWTGPHCEGSTFRRTEQAILQVLDSAQTQITLVSFAVYRIPNVAKALIRAAKRGVRLTVIVETPDRIERDNEYSTILALGSEVAACSTIYFWPKENRQIGENGKFGILHVKCAIADGEWMFLSSANLTQQAFTINMELGMLVRGGTMPHQIEDQFQYLIHTKSLVPI